MPVIPHLEDRGRRIKSSKLSWGDGELKASLSYMKLTLKAHEKTIASYVNIIF